MALTRSMFKNACVATVALVPVFGWAQAPPTAPTAPVIDYPARVKSVATLKEQELQRWLANGQNELQMIVADTVRNRAIFQLLESPQSNPRQQAEVNDALFAIKNINDHFQEFFVLKKRTIPDSLADSD